MVRKETNKCSSIKLNVCHKSTNVNVRTKKLLRRKGKIASLYFSLFIISSTYSSITQ